MTIRPCDIYRIAEQDEAFQLIERQKWDSKKTKRIKREWNKKHKSHKLKISHNLKSDDKYIIRIQKIARGFLVRKLKKYIDITGKPNITLPDNNKWVKLIPISRTSLFTEYNRTTYFKEVSNIELDTEVYNSGKKKGIKKRRTVIKFNWVIPKDEYIRKTEWIYLFVINGRIVKIGGTRDGLQGRCGSYLCGHHTIERGKSGSCSNTNAFIYNTFEFYLKLGCEIKMYGYELPIVSKQVNIFGKQVHITVQTYHNYESDCLQEYKKIYRYFPILSDNCDPSYNL